MEKYLMIMPKQMMYDLSFRTQSYRSFLLHSHPHSLLYVKLYKKHTYLIFLRQNLPEDYNIADMFQVICCYLEKTEFFGLTCTCKKLLELRSKKHIKTNLKNDR